MHLQVASEVPVPTDKLQVTVVADSYFDNLAPDEDRPALKIRRGRGPFQAQHGFSLHLESLRQGEGRRFLLDFAMTPEILAANLELLNLDVSDLDALILSHGHGDHFGGLVAFVSRHRQQLKPDLPIYLGSDDVFRRRFHLLSNGQRRAYGTLKREELDEAGLKVVSSETPIAIEGHALTTGTIPRVSFETVLPNTYVEVEECDDRRCCVAPSIRASGEGSRIADLEIDSHWSERATVFNLTDRGLVVITSCGHSGLINAILRAQDITGVEKIHAVMGGFHLSPAPHEHVQRVVLALKQDINPDYIIPMHCSGAPFVHEIARQMPEKLVTSYVGSRFIFSC